ncbi:MAG: site-2 protease family protein [Clostridia bacterium]|nr:site-2 protease family protein [Clostridia bacterium]
MNVVIGVLIAVFLFGIMIFLHEFGHYLTARLCKVKVEEFAVGMGPAIFSHRSKKSGILYSLRLLPIGGFTKMLGEDEAVSINDENGQPVPDPGALTSKKPWQRLIVLFAGSFMNVFTGIIAIFVLVCMQPGFRNTTVYAFDGGDGKYYLENKYSPTFQAGIRVGDRILKIGSHAIIDLLDLLNTVALDGTEPVDVTVEREGKEIVIQGVQFPIAESEGVKMGSVDFVTDWEDYSFADRLSQTGTRTVSTVKSIYNSLIKLITGKFGVNAVSGPVGTVKTIGQTVTSDENEGYRLETVLYLFSFISINLGIMNLLPLPALDGGRIIFVLIEIVIRRPVNRKYEGVIHFVGMVLLLLLMAVITISDVMKIIQ